MKRMFSMPRHDDRGGALRWIIAAVATLGLLVTVGVWIYIEVIKDDPPPPLSFETRDSETDATAGAEASTTGETAAPTQGQTTVSETSSSDGATSAPASTTSPATLDGSWTATAESLAGYRVKEVLFGQDTEAVGRTSQVTGSLTIAGTVVETTEFTVDMASVTSDEERRDNQYRGRVMDTDTYPTSTFVLTAPIDLASVPDDLVEVTSAATGDLTLRGTTKAVTFELKARRNGELIEVNGSIPIVFEEWGIPNPSFGPAQTEDNGIIEFLLVFERSG
jgi:polyisoprenoid-binding protein YceI